MMEVAAIAQASSGIRVKLMLGMRMLKIVTRKLIAPKIVENPMNCSAMAQSVCPTGVVTLNGG